MHAGRRHRTSFTGRPPLTLQQCEGRQQRKHRANAQRQHLACAQLDSLKLARAFCAGLSSSGGRTGRLWGVRAQTVWVLGQVPCRIETGSSRAALAHDPRRLVAHVLRRAAVGALDNLTDHLSFLVKFASALVLVHPASIGRLIERSALAEHLRTDLAPCFRRVYCAHRWKLVSGQPDFRGSWDLDPIGVRHEPEGAQSATRH